MFRFIVERMAALFATLVAVSVIIFMLVRLLPGSILDLFFAGDNAATPEQMAAAKRQLGLYGSYLDQYRRWISGVLHGDFGHSYLTQQPVADIMRTAIPIDIELVFLAIIDRPGDRDPPRRDLRGPARPARRLRRPRHRARRHQHPELLARDAAPHVHLAGVPLGAAARVRPVLGGPVEEPGGVRLPAIAISVFTLAIVTRMVRATMLEVLNLDYVRTARAKGAPRRTVLTKHALRNALVPVVTVAGFEVGALISGAAIAEIIYGLPGVGYQLLHAIFQRDYPIVQASTLLIAFVFVTANFFVDLLYGVPRSQDHRHMTTAVASTWRAIPTAAAGAAGPLAQPGRDRRRDHRRLRRPHGALRRPDLEDRPEQHRCHPPAPARAGRIRWAPTTSAATRSRGSSTARRCRSQVGAVAVGISLTAGLLIGLTAAFYRGFFDLAMMRVIDIVFAFPLLILAMLIAGLLGPSRRNAMIAIGIVYTPAFVRVIRAAVLEVMGSPFIESARSLGASDLQDHEAARVPEHRRAADRPHDRLLLPGDPRRVDPQLPRSRHPAARGRLGQHARDRARVHRREHLDVVVAGPLDHAHRPRLQLPRRRSPGHPRSRGSAAASPTWRPWRSTKTRSRTAAVLDLLIRDGLIVDGSGEPPYRGDVAVEEGRIAEVGRVDGNGAARVIEAGGRVVCPGFVDPAQPQRLHAAHAIPDRARARSGRESRRRSSATAAGRTRRSRVIRGR